MVGVPFVDIVIIFLFKITLPPVEEPPPSPLPALLELSGVQYNWFSLSSPAFFNSLYFFITLLFN